MPSRSKFGVLTSMSHHYMYIAEISLNVMLNHKKTMFYCDSCKWWSESSRTINLSVVSLSVTKKFYNEYLWIKRPMLTFCAFHTIYICRYLSEIDLVAEDFRQLVGGVIWLVRDGQSYVNESIHIECSDTEETGTVVGFIFVGTNF